MASAKPFAVILPRAALSLAGDSTLPRGVFAGGWGQTVAQGKHPFLNTHAARYGVHFPANPLNIPVNRWAKYRRVLFLKPIGFPL
jgi:hypothetical protein